MTFAASLAFLATSAAAQEDRGSGFGLKGTWRVTVTQVNCQTGAAAGNPFQSLLTFAAGGTMSGTTTNSAFLAGQRTGDFGVWSRTGWHSFAATSEALITFAGGPFSAGAQTLTHKITLTDDGNGFTDIANIQFYDTNAAPLLPVPGCATAVGKRMQ